jgi:predicted dehydrogenase
MRTIHVGVVGCVTISATYLSNLTNTPGLRVVHVADLFVDKAAEAAAKFGIPRHGDVKGRLADPEVELVVNLTIPASHVEVSCAALEAGKHVYCEKPLALDVEGARKTLELAARKGLRIGCAPDTFLGAGLQTCRKLLDEGAIGEVVCGTANLMGHGHESWHPAPEFYYKKGAGPMMDMGPYYLTALVSLLGPVESVEGFSRRTFATRTVTANSPKRGQRIEVEVPTHYTGAMRFRSGAVVDVNMSFDVWWSHLPGLEIYGTEGTLVLPDPNFFGGPVSLLCGKDMLDAVEGKPWTEAVEILHTPAAMDRLFYEVPLSRPSPAGNLRGLGVADLAAAIVEDRPHRASAELAFHVTEILTGFDRTDAEGRIRIASTCERPAPLPPVVP